MPASGPSTPLAPDMVCRTSPRRARSRKLPLVIVKATRRTLITRKWGRLLGFIGRKRPCRFEPSDTSHDRPVQRCSSQRLARSGDLVFPGGASTRPALLRSRCLPSPETIARTLLRLSRGAAPFRWPADRAAARVHRGFETRLDPCSLALAGAFKAACALATSASRCFHEHDYGPLEHPRSLEGDWGC